MSSKFFLGFQCRARLKRKGDTQTRTQMRMPIPVPIGTILTHRTTYRSTVKSLEKVKHNC